MSNRTLYAYRCLIITWAVVGLALVTTGMQPSEMIQGESLDRIIWAFVLVAFIMFFLDIVPACFTWLKNDWAKHGVTAACIIAVAFIVTMISPKLGTTNTAEIRMESVGVMLIGFAAYILVMYYISKREKQRKEKDKEIPTDLPEPPSERR